jgi:hypothetical protein
MLVVLIAASALLRASCAPAQQLVLNNGFEAFSRCPTGPGLIDGWVDAWHRTSVASTDYFNTCGFSSRPSRTGEAHVGLLAYDFSPNYREYLTGEISPPLQAGRTYRLDFWVILDDGRLHAVTELGAYFSVTQPTWPGTGPPGVFPQIENSGATIEDKVAWTRITGTYLASGGERYVTLGNFRDDATTTITGWPCCGQFGAYYHVDDVSIREDVPPPQLVVSCVLGGDTCDANSAASGDGRLDFDERVQVAITLENTSAVDVTSYAATLTASGATIVGPAGGLLSVASIPALSSVTVDAFIQLPPSTAAACGDPVDLSLVGQWADQGSWADDALAGCDFLLGDPAGDCGACVPAQTCLWRADASQLSPLTPPSSALFMAETPEGLSLQGPSWQCPLADGDLEQDANALGNGVPLSFYQVNLPTDTLRLTKAGTTIRFAL